MRDTITLCAVHNSGFNWRNGPLRCDAYRLMATPGFTHNLDECRERTFRQDASESDIERGVELWYHYGDETDNEEDGVRAVWVEVTK